MTQSKLSRADIDTILAFWKQYESTWDSGVIEDWIALWTDDGVQLPPGAPPNIGREQIREKNSAALKKWSFKTTIKPEQVSGSGDWAYSWGTYKQTFTPTDGGDPGLVDGKYMSIFKRQPDGSWKLHRDCFNSNVP